MHLPAGHPLSLLALQGLPGALALIISAILVWIQRDAAATRSLGAWSASSSTVDQQLVNAGFQSVDEAILNTTVNTMQALFMLAKARHNFTTNASGLFDVLKLYTESAKDAGLTIDGALKDVTKDLGSELDGLNVNLSSFEMLAHRLNQADLERVALARKNADHVLDSLHLRVMDVEHNLESATNLGAIVSALELVNILEVETKQ